MRAFLVSLLIIIIIFCGPPAHAELKLSSTLVEFTKVSNSHQDINVISRSTDNDDIETNVTEIIHPGQADETHHTFDDPSQGMVMVTPDKTILEAGNQKVLRFILLKEPDEDEHIYRVAVRPVVKGTTAEATKTDLKIPVSSEVLVVVRPATMHPDYSIKRSGKNLEITNSGNTNISFQNGKQCAGAADCKDLPNIRVYAGCHETINLPLDTPVTYSVGNGQEAAEKTF